MIQLYRKGTSHIVRGITCEMQTVSEFSYEALLKSGWHLSPEEAAATKDVEVKTAEKTEVPKETEEAKEAREAKAAAKVEAIKAKVAAKDAEKPKETTKKE